MWCYQQRTVTSSPGSCHSSSKGSILLLLTTKQGCSSCSYEPAPSSRRLMGGGSPTAACSLRQLREAMYHGYYQLDTSGLWASASQPKRRVPVITNLRSVWTTWKGTLDGMEEFLLILMQCPRSSYCSSAI